MAKRTQGIREMAEALYDDPEIAEHVVAHAAELGNTKRIEAGEMTLPHPHDAETWHLRTTGQEKKTAREGDTEARLAALEQLLAEMKDSKSPPTPDRERVLTQRQAELEGKVS